MASRSSRKKRMSPWATLEFECHEMPTPKVLSVDTRELSPFEASIIKRLDCAQTTREVANCVGLSHEELCRMLTDLSRRGVVRFTRPLGPSLSNLRNGAELDDVSQRPTVPCAPPWV